MRKIRVMIVDDEELQRMAVEELCMEMRELHVAGVCRNAREAEAFAADTKIDLALLDIEMPGENGIELGRRLCKMQPDLLVVYLTAYEEYALDAYRMQAVSYLLKPVQKAEFADCIQRVRKLLPEESHRIQVRMFGSFQLIADQKNVSFGYRKAAELLALLIDARGADVTEEKVISCLWEDRCYDAKTKALYRKTVMELRKVLTNENIESLCSFGYGRCRVNTGEFECDSYEVLDGTGAYDEAYAELGYLNEYSWGEVTRGYIETIC